MGFGLAWLFVQPVSAEGIRQQGRCLPVRETRQAGSQPHHRREGFECFECFERCECFKLNTRYEVARGLLADGPTVRHSAMAFRSSLVASVINVSIVVGRSQKSQDGALLG
jgi:hypothetical protein